jgi:hypothetical protein
MTENWDDTFRGLENLLAEFRAKDEARTLLTEQQLEELKAALLNLIEPLRMKQRAPLLMQVLSKCLSSQSLDDLRKSVLKEHPFDNHQLFHFVAERGFHLKKYRYAKAHEFIKEQGLKHSFDGKNCETCETSKGFCPEQALVVFTDEEGEHLQCLRCLHWPMEYGHVLKREPN